MSYSELESSNFFTSYAQPKGKGKVVPVLFLTEHHAKKGYGGSGGIATCSLDLGSRWR